MAIKILTLAEAKKTRKIAESYGECFEMLTGKAKGNYWCDNSGVEIPKGTDCAAVLLLPDKHHPNYDHQKKMLKDYLQ